MPTSVFLEEICNNLKEGEALRKQFIAAWKSCDFNVTRILDDNLAAAEFEKIPQIVFDGKKIKPHFVDAVNAKFESLFKSIDTESDSERKFELNNEIIKKLERFLQYSAGSEGRLVLKWFHSCVHIAYCEIYTCNMNGDATIRQWVCDFKSLLENEIPSLKNIMIDAFASDLFSALIMQIVMRAEFNTESLIEESDVRYGGIQSGFSRYLNHIAPYLTSCSDADRAAFFSMEDDIPQVDIQEVDIPKVESKNEIRSSAVQDNKRAIVTVSLLLLLCVVCVGLAVPSFGIAIAGMTIGLGLVAQVLTVMGATTAFGGATFFALKAPVTSYLAQNPKCE